MPERIQLSRKKGWRKPENTVVVSRPSKWGNPFRVGKDARVSWWPVAGDDTAAMTWVTMGRSLAVELFRATVWHRHSATEIRAELAGKDLACWCPLVDADGNPVPCHADVLLEIANQGEVR